MSHEVETMGYTGELTWHTLGIRVAEAMSSEEALKVSGLDWNVSQHPIYTLGNIVEAFDDETGERLQILQGYKQIPGKVSNVRDSDQSILGVVSGNYRVVQNREAFGWTDALLGAGVKYESAGSLFKGRRVWMLAKLSSESLLGDEIIPYLCFTNSHDGSTGVKVAITPVRVVCNNTLTMALEGARRIWTTYHVGDMNAKLQEAHDTLRLAKAYMTEMPVVAEMMNDINLDKTEVLKFVGELFPIDPELIDSKIHVGHIEYLRKTLLDLHDKTANLQPFKGTAWGYYNAVADMVNHVKPIRATQGYKERLFASTVDGHPTIMKAQKLLQAVKP